ncbi:inositol monophosphatase family protein [Nucisporomicrobium flavum]|uniref:inositol monophosphatase family protein n=1 Tax=Nucisporomicrobium flavum TaxID=2785915 RepID=UPI0027DAC085|nr:inositol monophosphatase family protein [Nucisporomicrobium flavum]
MQSDLDLARTAALAGAAVALRHFAALAGLRREVKPDGSVVTVADRETEAAIRAVLAAERPGDAILGEEGGAAGAGARRWIVDPIDGTAQFVAGDDRWLVLVALEEDGVVVAAVAAVPAQGTLWWARRGGGAYRSRLDGTAEQRIAVATGRPDVLDGSRLGVVPAPPNYLDTDRRIAAPLAARAAVADWDVHAPLLVASGGLDLAVQTRGQIWDFAATSLIVTEAGGAYGGVDGIRGPRAGTSLFARSADLWHQAHAALWPEHG